MQRLKFFSLVFLGSSLIIFGGGLLLFQAGDIQAQDDDEAEYVGARDCSGCHGDIARDFEDSAHALALHEFEDDSEYLLADFEQGEDVRMVQFPDEDEARPLEPGDIEYIVGKGRYVQRFLYEVDRDEYMVLPVEWNALEGVWQSYELAEAWPDAAYDWTTNCAYCHTVGLNVRRGRWEDDGVQCEACHGPGSIHVEVGDEVDVPLDRRDREEIQASINIGIDAQVCGQCHNRGVAEDDELPFPTEYFPGMELLNGYTLVAPDDATHWWRTGHAAEPNMQYNEWAMGGHATALTSLQESDYTDPTCLACHSANYQRAKHILANLERTSIEEEEMADFLVDLLEETASQEDIEFGEFSNEELREYLVTEFELDETTLNADEPIIPQVLPQLLNRALSVEELPRSSVMPVLFPEEVQNIVRGQPVDDESMAAHFGVTCTSCHNPHSQAGYEFNLIEDQYTLCVDCHNNNAPLQTIHHPVQEMYEGLSLVEGVAGSPSAHFTADNGPDCVTCHMEKVPVESATRASHNFNPILPGQALDIDVIQDGCTSCHEDIVTAEAMQQYIDDVQGDMASRIEAARTVVNDETPTWVVDALDFIEGDGSLGIHNYAYADELLDAVDAELGLFPEQ